MRGLPDVAAVELTYRCNHRCIFCSCPWEADALAKEQELDADTWRRAFREIRRRGTHVVSLSGGEPTLRSDLLSIIDAARCEGLHPCLVSNGRAVDETLLRELDAREVNLSISVPGIETFERQTGYNGVEHVMGLFRAARQMGMRVTANIAVTKSQSSRALRDYCLLVNQRSILHPSQPLSSRRERPGKQQVFVG